MPNMPPISSACSKTGYSSRGTLSGYCSIDYYLIMLRVGQSFDYSGESDSDFGLVFD